MQSSMMSRGRTTYRKRRTVLSSIVKVNNPSLIGIYQNVFRNHKEDMEQDEIFFCIRGLETIGDPKTIPLVKEIMAYCIEKNYSRDINGSRQLLQKLTATGDQ